MRNRPFAVLSAFLWASVCLAQVAKPVAQTAANPAPIAKPWRGSTLTYGHATSALSFNRAAEPFYNPFYAHRLELRPRWSFDRYADLSARFEVAQELTLSDDTTYRNEVVASDLMLEASAKGYQEPLTQVRVNGGLRVAVPFSKAAWAQTRVFSFAPGVVLSRSFPVKEGLSVSYDARYTFRFNRFTTAQYSGPTIAACGDPRELSCAEYVTSGVRNAFGDLSHGATVGFSPIAKLSLSSSFRLAHAFLYPLSPAEKPTVNGPVALPVDAGTQARHSWGLTLEAGYQVLPELSVLLGSSTLAPQLGPDGVLRNPFFNRTTTLYVDLALELEPLIARL